MFPYPPPLPEANIIEERLSQMSKAKLQLLMNTNIKRIALLLSVQSAFKYDDASEYDKMMIAYDIEFYKSELRLARHIITSLHHS